MTINTEVSTPITSRSELEDVLWPLGISSVADITEGLERAEADSGIRVYRDTHSWIFNDIIIDAIAMLPMRETKEGIQLLLAQPGLEKELKETGYPIAVVGDLIKRILSATRHTASFGAGEGAFEIFKVIHNHPVISTYTRQYPECEGELIAELLPRFPEEGWEVGNKWSYVAHRVDIGHRGGYKLSLAFLPHKKGQIPELLVAGGCFGGTIEDLDSRWSVKDRGHQRTKLHSYFQKLAQELADGDRPEAAAVAFSAAQIIGQGRQVPYPT